ncbi:MAG: hypothetical protein JSR82_23770 [Verrucomicrobia bacterium]|nr:hypothetical protein [Verrucomicrobiota bacterium]
MLDDGLLDELPVGKAFGGNGELQDRALAGVVDPLHAALDARGELKRWMTFDLARAARTLGHLNPKIMNGNLPSPIRLKSVNLGELIAHIRSERAQG